MSNHLYPHPDKYEMGFSRTDRLVSSALIAGIGLFGVAESVHARNVHAVEQAQIAQEEAATERYDAIAELALADPHDTALSIVGEFTVPSGSNISTEAFRELNDFLERRDEAGEPPIEGLETADETILISAIAHESKRNAQPGDLFLITTNSIEGIDEPVLVVQSIPEELGTYNDIIYYDENAS